LTSSRRPVAIKAGLAVSMRTRGLSECSKMTLAHKLRALTNQMRSHSLLVKSMRMYLVQQRMRKRKVYLATITLPSHRTRGQRTHLPLRTDLAGTSSVLLPTRKWIPTHQSTIQYQRISFKASQSIRRSSRCRTLIAWMLLSQDFPRTSRVISKAST
jgi:hypothetical protein